MDKFPFRRRIYSEVLYILCIMLTQARICFTNHPFSSIFSTSSYCLMPFTTDTIVWNGKNARFSMVWQIYLRAERVFFLLKFRICEKLLKLIYSTFKVEYRPEFSNSFRFKFLILMCSSVKYEQNLMTGFTTSSLSWYEKSMRTVNCKKINWIESDIECVNKKYCMSVLSYTYKAFQKTKKKIQERIKPNSFQCNSKS